ncbi:MAG: adenylate/guanylate cyclase domain-containing protein, partial [Nitrospirales bacterium]
DSLQQSHARTEGRLMAGLEVHANVVQTVLDQSFVQRSSPLTVSLMIIMLGLGCWIFIIVYPNNAIQVSGLSLLFLVFIVGLCVLLFIQGQYWLDVMPLLSVVNVHYGIGMAYQRYLVSRQKERLRSMFSQYLSPEVAEHLWNARGDLLQGSSQRPENLTVTTLAAGFDGFETMGNVEPDRILVWATDYLDEIGRLIIHYQGIVEDYTQDGILVHFGVLASRGSEGELCHDVRNAVGCAMAIHLALEKINAKWKDEHLPLLQVHAGICTGRAMTTTVGGRGRLKFATLGRPVWMALSLKRLAVSLSKDLGTPNIFCETETAQYLEKSFITRQVREIHSDTNTHSSMPYQILANVPMTSI